MATQELLQAASKKDLAVLASALEARASQRRAVLCCVWRGPCRERGPLGRWLCVRVGGGGRRGRLQAAPRWGVPPVHSFLWFDRSVAQTDKAARAALEAGEASAQAGEEAVGGEAFADAVRTLSSAPVLARLILAECKAEPPPALHAAACVLHDLCYTLFAEGGGAQEATARLCMEWWQAGSPGADRLVPSTLVYLVQHALCSGAARREGLIEGGRGGGGWRGWGLVQGPCVARPGRH